MNKPQTQNKADEEAARLMQMGTELPDAEAMLERWREAGWRRRRRLRKGEK